LPPTIAVLSLQIQYMEILKQSGLPHARESAAWEPPLLVIFHLLRLHLVRQAHHRFQSVVPQKQEGLRFMRHHTLKCVD